MAARTHSGSQERSKELFEPWRSVSVRSKKLFEPLLGVPGRSKELLEPTLNAPRRPKWLLGAPRTFETAFPAPARSLSSKLSEKAARLQ